MTAVHPNSLAMAATHVESPSLSHCRRSKNSFLEARTWGASVELQYVNVATS
jgi:hypothetical protein